MMKFQFNTLKDAIGLCEQLADDLVSFSFNAVDLIIETRSPIPPSTFDILKRITVIL